MTFHLSHGSAASQVTSLSHVPGLRSSQCESAFATRLLSLTRSMTAASPAAAVYQICLAWPWRLRDRPEQAAADVAEPCRRPVVRDHHF